jgi:hypothetical protein
MVNNILKWNEFSTAECEIRLQFLIKWKGYGYEENSWEREDEVNAQDLLIADFYRSHPGAPRRICSLVGVNFHPHPLVAPVGLHVSGHHTLDGG